MRPEEIPVRIEMRVPVTEVGNASDDSESEVNTMLRRIDQPNSGGEALSGMTASNPRQAVYSVLTSWFSRRFMTGFAILFPIVVTGYITYWFLAFFDSFFSPVYKGLIGFNPFGLGFVTAMVFIFVTGVVMSSWAGGILLKVGEWCIKKTPVVKHIYSASKQVSAAINPDNETAKAFKECVIIKHPRNGEYAFAFITGETWVQTPGGDLRLNTVYVPTNHVYVGDVFLLQPRDILKPNITVREGLEIVVSCGMAIPTSVIATLAEG